MRLAILVVFNGVVGNNTKPEARSRTEFQGFVLVDEYAPLVFVNSADFIAAQMFTLGTRDGPSFHRRDWPVRSSTGCVPADHGAEQFCHQVGSGIPGAPAGVAGSSGPAVQGIWATLIKEVARKFKVSFIVAARRALDLGSDRAVMLFLPPTMILTGSKAEGARFPARRKAIFGTRRRWRIGPTLCGCCRSSCQEKAVCRIERRTA